MNRPVARLWIYWVQDTNGEWIPEAHTSKRQAQSFQKQALRRGYGATEVLPYESEDPLMHVVKRVAKPARKRAWLFR